MQEIEIEKRFLITDWNKTNKHFVSTSETEMKDVYIPNGDAHKDLRLRRKGDSYMVTRKRPVQEGEKLVMKETTIELSQEEFDALSAGVESTVTKTRLKGSFEGLPAEVDVFKDRHFGLSVIEFEFKDMAAYKAFQAKNSLDKSFIDITEDESLAGGRLAEYSRLQLKELLKVRYNAPLYDF